MSDPAIIHESAEISSTAVIGAGTLIWQHCIVMADVRIGADCKLAHNVFVERGVSIGNGVTIKDNVALYDGVLIEDDAFIGPNAVFTNVLTPRAFIQRKDEFAQTVVAHGASIGANATIVCGIRVGAYALIGAGAVVTHDVADHALVVGNPARTVGWVGRSGRKLDESLTCPESGERYEEYERGLRMVVSPDNSIEGNGESNDI
jgi:UDP-2-acetamido-3-amino-2,3-dideoxy-glucuronate N-acetyltransferase